MWVWTAATLVVVAVAVLAWRGSDAAATSSTTAAPPATPAGTPAAALTAAWSVDTGGPATASVVESDRVVVPAADGVAMVDPATGEEAWHYTRSGARLCGATAVDGVVVVLFSTGGRCDELTALRATTGERVWYRSVGFRADATLTSTDRIVLATSPTGLATVDPLGNNIRWHHAADAGCRLVDATAGTTGVALLQRCADGGLQAQLLDGFDGTLTWSRPLGTGTGTARLAGADGVVGVVDGDQLLALRAPDGGTLQTLPLPADDGTAPLQTSAGGTALLWARGTLTAVDTTTGAAAWSVPAVGLPATPDGKQAGTSVVVPEDGAFVTRDLLTGTELGRSTAPAVPVGARTAVVGPVVVVGTTGERAAFS
ncbi:Outer membrane protein assembly factor BamB, contains PQQ-like beta-propeller repeat [Klenkia brasiliensis]|uniref:Outer membrane protein assembly factor BamB, contains PQQ-like beta-propeller repeat n=1 Tax=Klenkia brasiliensis TaxID=333142 RepID=A0A1G7WCF7_9ACTN|nr:Outer membrane protein assembly factor BamB, contains PQQ-like beta-propeller repeat [Klenkia brasiliensis]